MLSQMPVWRSHLLAVLLLGASAVTSAAPGISCSWHSDSDSDSFNGSWVQYGASCYKWIEAPDYWYPAEQSCRLSGGHLVSIKDERENTVVGRLTYCQAAWIGLYGVHADQLGDIGKYRWTDGATTGYSGHNFSRLATPHQPLVTAEDGQWFNNLYHARSSYVCKAPSSTKEEVGTDGCSAGWRRVGNYCFMQPPFQATYIEAGYYCDGKQAHLASVHSERELRLLSLLDLSQPSCTVELWLGLVKLNPCREDYPANRKQQICYRWADRSGEHRGFPAWEAGHPIGDQVTNCIVLKDRSLRSEPCYKRHNFVCKRPVRPATPEPPTVKPPTERPPTHPPTGKPPTEEPPTRLPTGKPPTEEPPTRPTTGKPPTVEPPTRPPTGKPPTEEPPTEEPSTEKPPTVEPPTRLPTGKPPTEEPPTRAPTGLPPSIYMAAYDFRRGLQNLAQPGRFRIQDTRGVTLRYDGAVLNGSFGIQVDTESSRLTRPLKENKEWTIYYYLQRAQNYDEPVVDIANGKDPSLSLLEHPDFTELSLYGRTGTFKDDSHPKEELNKPWVHTAVVFSAGRAYFYRNGVDVSNHSPATTTTIYDDNDVHLMLGHINGQSTVTGYSGVLACFGVVHAALKPEELAAVFKRYCPDT